MVDDDDDFWSTEAGGSTSFKKFNCQFYSLASVAAAVLTFKLLSAMAIATVWLIGL